MSKPEYYMFSINGITHWSKKPSMSFKEFYDNYIDPFKSNLDFNTMKIYKEEITMHIKDMKNDKENELPISEIKSISLFNIPKKLYKIIINGKTYKTTKKVITKKDIMELFGVDDETYNIVFYNVNRTKIEKFNTLSLADLIIPIFYISKEEIMSYRFTINGYIGYLPFKNVCIEMIACELIHIGTFIGGNKFSYSSNPVEILLSNNERLFYLPLDSKKPEVLVGRKEVSYDINLLVNDEFYLI